MNYLKRDNLSVAEIKQLVLKFETLHPSKSGKAMNNSSINTAECSNEEDYKARITVPVLRQFEWIISLMGLVGCPASFQHLVEMAMQGLVNLIVSIDVTLLHSKGLIGQTFQQTQKHQIEGQSQKMQIWSRQC